MQEDEALFDEPMKWNEPFEGIHRPIKRQPRFLNQKGKKEGQRKGLDTHMRDRYAKSRGDPDQWRGFKVYARNIPRTNRGISRIRGSAGRTVAPLSRGSRQRDLKNDLSLPPITPRVVAGPSLIETSPASVWKTIYPRWWKSYKTRRYIRRQNITGWSILELLYPSWKFLRMCQLRFFWAEKTFEMKSSNIFLIFFFFWDVKKNLADKN